MKIDRQLRQKSTPEIERQLSDNLTLALESFYTAKESEHLSPRTLEVYEDALDDFAGWLRGHGVTDPKAITPAHVRGFFVDVAARGYTAWTIHGRARPVKTFLKFLYTDGIIPADVMVRVKMPKLDEPVLPAFTPEEVQAILKACVDQRETTLVLFLLDTGVRAAELCAITVGDVNVKTGAVLVRRGKGAKGRVVYIGAKSRRAVLKYLLSRNNPPEDAPLFPSLKRHGFLTPDGLLQITRRLKQRSQVAHCHPHTFRRTMALTCLRNGMNIFALQRLMGHEDITVLRRYLAIAESDVSDAHRQFGAVDHAF